MDLAILLSTYNSSKYLREQLDSILNQTFTDFKLYIRDDGSTDNTLEIINEYVNINNGFDSIPLITHWMPFPVSPIIGMNDD